MRMWTYAGLFLVSLTTVASVQPACRFSSRCPCGQSGNQVVICSEEKFVAANLCSQWANCRSCRDGLTGCLECPEGFEGPSCTKAASWVRKESHRERRQAGRNKSAGREEYDEDETGDEFDFCDFPGTIGNGRGTHVSGTPGSQEAADYPSGARFKYSCNTGYSLVGVTSLTCERGGFWSSEVPSCRKDSSSSCEDPGFVSNAQRRLVSDDSRSKVPRTFRNGESVFYSCKSGDYYLKGSPVLTCRNGQWSGSKPRCRGIEEASTKEVKFCPNPGPISDGTVSVHLPDNTVGSSVDDASEYPEGTQLLYYCGEDYALIGFSVLTCQSTGSWSSDPPMCSSECGRIFVEDHAGKAVHRVIHGSQTKPGEWPWIVAIGLNRGNFTRIECGGALLDGQTVITAAHCLVTESFTLYFGKLHRSIQKDDTEVMVRQSTHWFRHKDYNSTNMDCDIGMIKFAPKIQFSDRIQPICPPSRESTARNLMTGRSGYVTGWGLDQNQVEAEELRMAELPVLTNSACRESYKQLNNFRITDNMFCAGHDDARQAVCRGDSGSPLVFYNSLADRYTLEGLVSFGVQGQCGQRKRYTLFTRVLRFVPWILKNLS